MNRNTTRIGYARISTTDQRLDAQIAALKHAGCNIIREERKSGTSLEGRPELKIILDFIHKGETLVVTRIDRLARSLQDLQLIVEVLKSKGASLYATEQPVDTSTATGKAFFDMLGVFAEFETNLRRGFELGLRVAVPLPDGSVFEPEKIIFEMLAESYGLAPDDFGREFSTGKERFKITGIDTRRPKYSISVERIPDRRSFKFTPENVSVLLKANSNQ